MVERQKVAGLVEQLANGSADDPDASWKAAIALGDVEPSEEQGQAVNALVRELASGLAHALIRAHAAESLGKLGNRQAVPALIGALRDPYQLTRAYAARSLGYLGDPQAIEPLLGALQSDEFYGARAEAARALASLGAQRDSITRQRIRDGLLRQRQIELSNATEGAQRPLAEIDRALGLI